MSIRKKVALVAIVLAATTYPAGIASAHQEELRICDLEPVNYEMWLYQLLFCRR
jgi:hypothetical protein